MADLPLATGPVMYSDVDSAGRQRHPHAEQALPTSRKEKLCQELQEAHYRVVMVGLCNVFQSCAQHPHERSNVSC
eukprot:SAG31_NODE_3414_length_4302_cov_20.546239_4_plen_75_part_00